MIKDIPGLINKVKTELQNFTDVAVVGLSGGADSTLVSLLCVEALGKENVIGVHMPYNQFDQETFNSNSKKLSECLGIGSVDINIGTAADVLVMSCEKSNVNLSKLNKGNMRSRMRMISLYAVCKSIEESSGCKTRVIGTDNFSENFLAYFTKFGDGGVDYSPIVTLFKSEVYQLLDYFRDQGKITDKMIERKPSAGLWDNQSDEEELGFTYDKIEVSIRKYLSGAPMCTDCDKMVLDMHKNNMHKNRMPPSLDLTEFTDH